MPVMGEVQTEPTLILSGSAETCKIGEPKVSGGKELEPNYSDEADKESHDNNNHGIFCVTRENVDCIDIDDLY